MRVKIVLSWLIGGLVGIILMLCLIKAAKINIPNSIGFIIILGLVMLIQKYVFKLSFQTNR